MSRDPRQSRGFRNRNPGNIDWNERNKWQGQVGREETGNPPRFAVFQSHEYGIRALAMLLTTYQDRHGLRTIRGIINRWAPPVGDSNGAAPGGQYTQSTSGYVAHVARLTGRDADEALDLHRYGDLRPLVEAIITHELGGQPYDAATIDAGLRLAGVVAEGRAAVARTGTARAAAGTAAAGVGAMAVVEAVQAAAPHVGALAELADRLGPWTAALAIVAAAAWFVWQRSRRTA